MKRRESLRLMAGTAAAAYSANFALAAPARLRLIVLDVGGTIIRDRGDVPEALQGAFAKYGISVKPEEIAQWRGASKREVVRHFADERSSEKGARLEAVCKSIYGDFTARAIEAYKTVPPIPGAEAAFQSLQRDGFLLAATTGFGREIATSIFRRLDWEKYFTAIITSDDVAAGRPAPFMIFHAMEAARVSKVAEVMTVGDTPLDLQAGANAGVRGVVGVLSGASNKERLEAETHTEILASVAELPNVLSSRYSR